MTLNMNDKKSEDVGKVWWFWFTTSAFDVDKRLRRIFRMLPHDPRCRFCNAPFRGVGGSIVRAVFGKQQSVLNPRFCLCEVASRQFPGGAEMAVPVKRFRITIAPTNFRYLLFPHISDVDHVSTFCRPVNATMSALIDHSAPVLYLFARSDPARIVTRNT